MIQGNLFNVIESNSTWQPSEPPSLASIDEIVMDVETTGLKWWGKDEAVGIAIGYKRDNQYVTQYLPWGHRGGGNLPKENVMRWLRHEVRGKKIKNLNSRFDNHMIYKEGIDLEEQGNVWGDIAHYMALLDDQRKFGFSLEAISQELIGKGKVKGLNVPNLAAYHAGEAEAYARNDVELVLQNMDKLRPQLKRLNLMKVADLEDELIFAVCEMERNGSPIDVEKLQMWIQKSEREVTQYLWDLYKLVGTKINPADRDDMVKLYRIRGLEIKHWTDGGKKGKPQPSFKDEFLVGIRDPAIKIVRQIRKLQSFQSKYLYNYLRNIDSNGIIRYALHQLRADEGGTISGRFSSSAAIKGDDQSGINIQQVMRSDAFKEFKEEYGLDYSPRELFIPNQGLWLKADARQIEFRLFVHFSRSQRLIAEYTKDPNVDFHNIVWDILKPFKEGISRKLTKDTNFAQLFGAGIEKTGQMLRISPAAAEEFVNIYRTAFPEVLDLGRRAAKIAKQYGVVKSVLGRRFNFPDEEWTYKALSRIIQGSAADVMKKKLVLLHRERKNTGFKMRFTVHDEVDGDAPDKESVEKVKTLLNEQSINFRVPLLWEVKSGSNWRELN